MHSKLRPFLAAAILGIALTLGGCAGLLTGGGGEKTPPTPGVYYGALLGAYTASLQTATALADAKVLKPDQILAIEDARKEIRAGLDLAKFFIERSALDLKRGDKAASQSSDAAAWAQLDKVRHDAKGLDWLQEFIRDLALAQMAMAPPPSSIPQLPKASP
ncbi:MAG: hypothetical protein R3E60_06895 [Alphaproteobacteria bacterium]